MKNIVIAIIIGTMSCFLFGHTEAINTKSNQYEYLRVNDGNQEANVQILSKNTFIQNK